MIFLGDGIIRYVQLRHTVGHYLIETKGCGNTHVPEKIRRNPMVRKRHSAHGYAAAVQSAATELENLQPTECGRPRFRFVAFALNLQAKQNG